VNSAGAPAGWRTFVHNLHQSRNDYYESGEREVGIDFFAKDVGYAAEDKGAIDALAAGQEWQCPDGSNHTVIRLS